MIKKLLLGLALMAIVAGFTGASAFAIDCNSAGLTAQQALACGANNGAANSDTVTQGAAGSLSTTVGNIVEVMSLAVGIISIIMMVLGGLRFVSSGGNQEAVSGAKKTIIFALVGLMITAIAQVLVKFVLKKV